MVEALRPKLVGAPEIVALGLEILGFSILAIKPTPETARALEAETREQLLKEADDAIFRRRNAAVENERAIKENELNTENAVELKRRQIRETKMDADRAVQEKQRLLGEAEMAASVALEEKKKELVLLTALNTRAEADARAYGLAATMKALGTGDPRMLQAVAAMRLPWDADHLYFTVREPFPTKTTGASLVFGRVSGEKPLLIESHMPERGVIFSDGIEADFVEFNSGSRVKIAVAERKGVLVV